MVLSSVHKAQMFQTHLANSMEWTVSAGVSLFLFSLVIIDGTPFYQEHLKIQALKQSRGTVRSREGRSVGEVLRQVFQFCFCCCNKYPGKEQPGAGKGLFGS